MKAISVLTFFETDAQTKWLLKVLYAILIWSVHYNLVYLVVDLLICFRVSVMLLILITCR